jgi:hypothetical protein
MKMKRAQLEARVLRAVEAMTAGAQVETSEIEFKREWLPPDLKVARRIAAHANDSRGEPCIWVIGADDGKKEVTGAADTDIAKWWPQVQSHFDEGWSPTLDDVISVPIDRAGKSVVALLFDTTRAPYVVRVPQAAGGVDRDVPWREGTATRSARRSDLLKLLVPSEALPTVEAREGRIITLVGESGPCTWRASLRLYIVPSSQVVHFPLHGILIECRFPPGPLIVEMNEDTIFTVESDSSSLNDDDGTLSVHRPSIVTLEAHGASARGLVGDLDAELVVRLEVVRGAHPISVEVPFKPARPNPHTNADQVWLPPAGDLKNEKFRIEKP